MGSAFTPGGNYNGVIPNVMDTIFTRIASMPEADFTVRVGFVEIHQVKRQQQGSQTLIFESYLRCLCHFAFLVTVLMS